MSTLAVQNLVYKEHVGRENLSRKYQSNQVFTPSNSGRFTISDLNYKRYFNATPKVAKVPWGRSRSYGGLGAINLPSDHRSKWEPPLHVEKGHLHYGAGVMPHPSGMKIQQFYDLTKLSKSNVRRNDQLLPSANQENIGAVQVNAKFPAEHPFASHSSRFSLFPVFDTPVDMKKGEAKHLYQPTLPPETPSAAPDPKIIGKSRGTPARREEVSLSRSSTRSPLKWLDGPNFYQLPKGPEKERQIYYPCPPSTVRPASGALLHNTTVTPKTADKLNQVHKALWVSTYRKDFNGRSELEPNGMLGNSHASTYYPMSGSQSPANMQEDIFMKYGSASPDALRMTASEKNASSRRSSMESVDVNEADGNESTENLSKSAMSTTPKSVQFRRSVTFSDGKSMREIPLNESSPFESMASHYPKTPFHGQSSLHSDLFSSESQKEAVSKGDHASKSINTMPSQQQTKDKSPTVDPTYPPKFFRPHTVGNPRSSTELLNVRDNWSRSDASKRFHAEHPETTPDLRRKPDLRFTDNEKRHVIPEAETHTYLFRGSDHM
eukprot:gene3326-3813_t